MIPSLISIPKAQVLLVKTFPQDFMHSRQILLPNQK